MSQQTNGHAQHPCRAVPSHATVIELNVLPTARLSIALQLTTVGFAVGFSAQQDQNIKARQALGFVLEVQVQNLE